MRTDRAVRFAIGCTVAAAVLTIDQVTKAIAVSSLGGRDRIPLLGDLLGLQLAFNPGIALSFGADQTWLITILTSVLTAGLCVALVRSATTMRSLALGFILGGAFGNLVDRLFAPPAFGEGHVIDFLAYGELFIGNLADVALAIGAIILAIDLPRTRAFLTTAPSDTAATVGAAKNG
ncbi:signal peptidase II [Microbacterium sp. NPDC096154]|uniref:signal peptidase II n=1 Tax=Microbacterium sp. NPDC096154 TaxID=3155549 RepID=UPI0033267BBC